MKTHNVHICILSSNEHRSHISRTHKYLNFEFKKWGPKKDVDLFPSTPLV